MQQVVKFDQNNQDDKRAKIKQKQNFPCIQYIYIGFKDQNLEKVDGSAAILSRRLSRVFLLFQLSPNNFSAFSYKKIEEFQNDVQIEVKIIFRVVFIKSL